MDLQKQRNQIGNVAKQVGTKLQGVATQALEKGKEGSSVVKEKYDVTKRELEKKRLCPIFVDEIASILDYEEPFLIRIIDNDKHRQESEVCTNSVGFFEKIDGNKVMHLYTKDADNVGIHFYPYIQEGLYCPNPYIDNMYISLDDYFDTIKKARADELETIGHKLGAKYVKVSFKEKKTYFTNQNAKAKANVKGSINGSIEASNKSKDEEYSDIKVAVEVRFEGSPWPEKPEVVYFKNESDIESLIRMRMDDSGMNDIISKTYTFEANKKSVMTKETALKIDSIIKKLKCSGNGTVSNKVESECRTVLEYVVEF